MCHALVSHRKIREYWQAEQDARKAEFEFLQMLKQDRESQVAERMRLAAEETERQVCKEPAGA